jgi:hypothetical protein
MSPMTRIKTLVLAIVIAIVPAAIAQEGPCPCVPLGYTWTVTPCETWNCAASALVTANGDAYTFVLPTTSEKYKWVILKRIVSGAVVVSPDDPILIERFRTMIDGSARYAALDPSFAPLLVTATDGNILVTYLRTAETGRTRAIRH